MNKFIIALILIPAMLISLADNKAILKGNIYDQGSNKSLTGVNLTLLSDGKIVSTTITDRYGNYEFNVEPGTYSLAVTSYVIKDSVFKNIELNANKSKALDLAIIQHYSSKRKSRYRSAPDIKMMHTDGAAGGKEVLSRDEVILEAATTSYSGTSEDNPLMPVESGKKSIRSKSGDYEIADEAAPPPPQGEAGVLTSGEINDFRKWDMWNDITENDLAQYRTEWSFNPYGRYSVQVLTNDKMPAVDYKVRLMNNSGDIVWETRTDNTGKAELWNKIFDNQSGDERDFYIEVETGAGKEVLSRITEFHNGVNKIELQNNCSVPSEVDILFVVDATGSMGDEINYLKAELKDIMSKLKDRYDDINLNLGSVFYRDSDDEYLIRKSELNNDIDKTIEFINQQDAQGGGDFPEAVDMALQSSLNDISWSENARARILFLILDAPPHNDPEVKEKLKELSARAAIQGVRLVPVTCSGIDKSTEYLMRSLALATNGTYAFITDHSGVGGKHLEPTTDKYDVELLNDLFLRLIDQFVYVPECANKESVIASKTSENIFNKDESRLDEIDNMFKCYPNPCNGQLNITLDEAIEEMFLTDMTGKIVKRFDRLPAGQHVLDLSSFPTGVYYLKYRIGENWGFQKIMMVR